MKKGLVFGGLMFALRFVPVLRNIPFVINHGTVDGALAFVNKALVLIEKAAHNAQVEVAKLDVVIDSVYAAKLSAEQEAARAKRVSDKLTALLA